ncbi:protein kinase domain-containing protein [Arenimonas sp. MALMAid1274]|uniref:protein kinase domain-containing protein n=1 Tax=Arenimonas sp. MALMAid1274 TaxID=3411630 RepID=UPI003BA1437E
MSTSLELKVLQVFEQALEQPPSERIAWLSGQGLAPEVQSGVLRLLDAEKAAGSFLEETAVLTEEVPPKFPKVGERLGNYELLKPLESGGMGVVYLGRRADDVYEQQVAIKLVRPVHMLGAADFRRQLIARFEDERAILARLNHPNVARILDGGSTASGIPYLVMEYVDGISLTDFCKERKLDVRQRLALFRKVCDGVQEAHRHLIVHRDLKPDNILVGVDGEPRLLDFGIAKILEREPLGGSPGTALSAMTPAYASPEQVRQQPLTTSSDVYSLGVVLYQLVTGMRPYELAGLRPSEAEHVVCDLQPEPMRRMLDKAPLTEDERRARRAMIVDDVERIVAKAMHKDATRRYGSAQELADDIGRYLDGMPVQAGPDSAAYRVGKFLARHRLGAIAASLALLAILGTTAFAFWQADQARRAANDATRINNFLMDVIRSSDPFNAGSEITMSQAVDEAVVKVGPRFADRPDLSSRIRFALGYGMISRYKLDLAEEQLQFALDESTAAYGAGDVRTLRILEGQAQLRHSQGRNDEAEALFRRVLASMEEQRLQDDPFYGIVLNNLGNFHMFNEDYEKADELLRRAEVQLKAHPDPEAMPSEPYLLVGNLAYTAHGLGDLARAETLYTQARKGLERVYPRGSPELASLINNHAFLVAERGEAEKAFELWQQSLAMRRRAFKGDHPMLVTAMNSVAIQAMRLKKFNLAKTQAEESVAMSARLYPEPTGNQIMAVSTLGGARLMSGDPQGAGQALQQGVALLGKMRQPEEYLAQNLQKLLDELCKRPHEPAVEACAGITPTEPALP